MTYKVGDKLRCVNNDDREGELTVGSVYEIFEFAIADGFASIINDRGFKFGYALERFEKIPDGPQVGSTVYVYIAANDEELEGKLTWVDPGDRMCLVTFDTPTACGEYYQWFMPDSVRTEPSQHPKVIVPLPISGDYICLTRDKPYYVSFQTPSTDSFEIAKVEIPSLIDALKEVIK